MPQLQATSRLNVVRQPALPDTFPNWLLVRLPLQSKCSLLCCFYGFCHETSWLYLAVKWSNLQFCAWITQRSLCDWVPHCNLFQVTLHPPGHLFVFYILSSRWQWTGPSALPLRELGEMCLGCICKQPFSQWRRRSEWINPNSWPQDFYQLMVPNRSWFKYSVKDDAAYCFPGR